MKLKFKIIISTVLVIVCFIGTLIIMAFSGRNLKAVSNISIDTYDKIKDGVISGNQVNLSSDELNSIIGMYIKDGINKNGLIISAIKLEVIDNTLNCYISIKYKGNAFLLSTAGYVKFKDSKLIYNPQWLKVGKLPLPKNLVFNFMKKYNSDNINFDNNEISIDSKVLPYKIETLGLKGSNALVQFIKQKNKKITEEQNVVSALKESNNSSVEETQSSVTQKPSASTGDSESTVSTTNSLDPSTLKSLQLLSSQLSSAISCLKDSSEKEILGAIQGAVNSKITDSSYDISVSVKEVKTRYSLLPSNEKKDIKGAIFSNVDLENASILKSLFGI